MEWQGDWVGGQVEVSVRNGVKVFFSKMAFGFLSFVAMGKRARLI
jgi:hypothetical protein